MCGGGSGKVEVVNEPGVSIGNRAGLVWTPNTLTPIYDPGGSFAEGSTATIMEIDITPFLSTVGSFKHFLSAAQAYCAPVNRSALPALANQPL
jgi:hypothetical protein